MKKHFLAILFLLNIIGLGAQTNVRAWYAQGQVWVVWQTAPPFPETFAVYKKASPFSNISQATVIGRLFQYEYLPGTFIEQTANPNFTYKIPKPDGSIYTLAPGEGLFVETVTGTGSAYYAVVEWGNTMVTAGVNITQSAVPYTYDPVNEPVNCHLQLSLALPTSHKTNWYSMWAMGRQEHWAGRPDFPVMANAFKNGMPSMFIVSEALGMDTSGGKKIPMTHWFHGGGMLANQFLANDFRVFNIEPKQGISVSHNDDFAVKTISDGDTVFTTGRSLWFGWAKAHNPFNPGFDAGPGDTVINYTQRRILWINHWLINHYNADPDQVALQGYSMGSGGASALGKAYPNRFSTVCGFNNGFRSAIDGASEHIVGSIAENLPTNLRGTSNEVIRINEVFDLNTRTSAFRDFPLFRTWAGKNDPNDRMHWGPDLVAQYRKADSLGWGTQISWDERFHVYDPLGMHWIQDLEASQQTYRDNLDFQENFRSNQSYPAFFNHRLEPLNNDPGDGTPGIGPNGSGDDWGTWGGYHRWDETNITDLPGGWSAVAWLESSAVFGNDNCPVNNLTADLAIRRPQQFKQLTGKLLNYTVKEVATGNTLKSGTTIVQADNLVVIPQVVVYRENIRRVRISVTDPSVAAWEPGSVFSSLRLDPNPSFGDAMLSLFVPGEMDVEIKAIGLEGKQVSVQAHLEEGENSLLMTDFKALPAGVYFVSVAGEGFQSVLKWVKI